MCLFFDLEVGMAANPDFEHMSIEDYLALLEHSDARYEYREGIITMMSGGTYAHMRIAINLYQALEELFLSGPCRVFNSDMAVLVDEKKYYFPDVTISCDVDDHRLNNPLVRSPHLVCEVLSDSTELKDRGVKLRDYQACPTIQEYILVSSKKPLVEVYTRDEEDEGQWRLRQYSEGGEVLLASLDISISLEDIYRRIF